jgi:hypothetical protein
MPRTTIDGDDPAHDLPPDEKDELERQLRAEARTLLREGIAKRAKQLINRARNISRRPSDKAEHH